MANNWGLTDRRSFLIKSASFFAGSLLGLPAFSKAFASDNSISDTRFQPWISLIIDDIGYRPYFARQFLELKAPLTFAILPQLPKTHELAMEIHHEGHEIMLHQPMEPYNRDIDPGPGALYVKDSEETIIRVLEENIVALPFAVGVNNHMGSRFTERQKQMIKALQVIKKRNLYFIDSLTTHRSMAYRTARTLHMATGFRNIFLDNRPDETYIRTQLCRLKKYARKYGRAIGIGHPYPETVRTIGHFLRELQDTHVSLVPVSRLLHA